MDLITDPDPASAGRETEILALYLAMRESIDQRISELKQLRALCAPGKAGAGPDGRQTPRSFVPGILTNGRTREIQDCVNSSAALSTANKLHKLALAGGDQLAIDATAAKVALMQARHDAALARKAAAKLAPVLAVVPALEAAEILPPVMRASDDEVTPETGVNDPSILTVVSADIAAAFGLENLPGATIVPAEILTPEQRFAAAFQDGASVPPKAAKPRKVKSASATVPAAGKSVKTARKGQKASV